RWGGWGGGGRVGVARGDRGGKGHVEETGVGHGLEERVRQLAGCVGLVRGGADLGDELARGVEWRAAVGVQGGLAGYELAATIAGSAMSSVVTRRSSRRYFASSNGVARCIVARLSQITRSPMRQA